MITGYFKIKCWCNMQIIHRVNLFILSEDDILKSYVKLENTWKLKSIKRKNPTRNQGQGENCSQFFENERILESNDATSVLCYQLREKTFKCWQTGPPNQMFVLGLIKVSPGLVWYQVNVALLQIKSWNRYGMRFDRKDSRVYHVGYMIR